MFKNLLIVAVVICCCNIVTAQNVFDPTDPIINYNSSATPGSATNPFQPSNGVMAKWVRTPYASITWNTSNFKCYIWNNMCFRLRFPNNYNPANASKYPVLIFYHGGGEIGSVYNNDKQLLWGAQIFEQRINNNEWNGFLLFPQETSIGWNDYHFSRVNSILDTLQKYNNADPDRVITMGLSAGGYGSVGHANLYPGRIAAALSSSPYQINSFNTTVAGFIHVPVWVANGGLDGNPAPADVQSFYSSFRNAGGNLYRTFFAANNHNTWTDMWNQKNPAGAFITTTYWNAAHKAQPLVYFQNQQFCSTGPIAARMGISDGYFAYEWQRDGVTIPGATDNEYIATVAGQYRVRFMRVSGGDWSAWTPNPVVISTKVCATDTLFTENFSGDNNYTSTATYSKGNFKCQNGVFTNATNAFTQDAAGIQGGGFLVDFTTAPTGAGCTYTAGSEVWGSYSPVNVLPNTNYEYTFYIANQSDTSLAQLAPTINGVALIPGYAQATGTGNASWKKFTYTWNSGAATTADLGIINRSSVNVGNNFAIDEISFKLAGTIRTLPVTWLQVAAKLVGKDAQITWKVSDEVNVSNYTVERSSDGLSFSAVAVVSATTTTALENQYQATDKQLQKGVTYYRIKQTDKDGKYSYSKTVLVHVTDAGEVVVWPNPATSTLNVQNGQVIQRLQCFNSTGQLVLDVKPSANQYSIPVQQWAPGVYYITVTGTSQSSQTRFIKQ